MDEATSTRTVTTARAVAKDVVARVKESELILLAAGVAFFGLLALIPSLIAAVSIYGLVSDPDDVARQVEAMSATLPDSARDLVAEQMDSIASTPSGSLSVSAVISILLALWSASAGVARLIAALNIAYRVPESRGAVKLRGLALAITAGIIVGVVLAIGAIVVVPAVASSAGAEGVGSTLVSWLRWPALLVGFQVGLAVLYRIGPDRPDSRLRWLSWGSGIATVAWVAGSALFSLYVSWFGTFNETYGSLAGVVVMMLWLLLSSLAILVGAAVDAAVEAPETELRRAAAAASAS